MICYIKRYTDYTPILGYPGAASREDIMSVVKVYYKIETSLLNLIVNFHHEHSILATSCRWVYAILRLVQCSKKIQVKKTSLSLMVTRPNKNLSK